MYSSTPVLYDDNITHQVDTTSTYVDNRLEGEEQLSETLNINDECKSMSEESCQSVINDLNKLYIDTNNKNNKTIRSFVQTKRAKDLRDCLKNVGETSKSYLEALPKQFYVDYDIWDLKRHESILQLDYKPIAALFQNTSSDRWSNISSLGDPEETLYILRRGKGSEVLVDKFGIEITRKHLSCLHGLRWLNDEVINFYMELIQERNNYLIADGIPDIPRCMCFNTFFFTLLCGGDNPNLEYNYKAVERWTTRKNVDIFDLDILLIPIHKNKTHWYLGVVDMRPGSRCILTFDSLGGSHRLFFKNIRRWLQDEHIHKKGKPLESIDDWKYNKQFQAERIAPMQYNGYDCGVFLCQYAECISIGKMFDFTQSDIKGKRTSMIQQILRGSIFK
ncbi:Ulp1 protease family C-terminal catalytic domain protein [Babesia bovis T2Bo]|uniref:Ulp1 protease family, C-terminal catalytic domain containing protein n=1 Tax=Babesia bovis TaxID=5865 RepID=A7ATV3_BABBO|nr:Ulp1 protease family C-terminal catalytic domain protein [Babesia bovis T2Bo]EDO06364.1 Ulp1 protease family C-terminal catalytic domain protein [Babesia bovis T2Bo]|eukprot:XP_001609932.1 ulp1 protease family, C-terminal catalytic domain containing protein [Babesia bovis T2Bo]